MSQSVDTASEIVIEYPQRGQSFFSCMHLYNCIVLSSDCMICWYRYNNCPINQSIKYFSSKEFTMFTK